MAADRTVPPALVSAFNDRYELLREAGRGGSATVYLARDIKHDRQVAIKLLSDDVGDVSGDRFLLEIRVSAGMQHPHILPTYDSGIADGRLYFVMPFVDGGSLRDRLEKPEPLQITEALGIARDIAVALAHAHMLGVVHRDVKPENIMFYHGVACLADFGIARAIEEMNPLLTAHGTFVGTPAYMSPEQYAAVGVDGRSDVYSLACVLFEMLSGKRLFGGRNTSAILAERGVPFSRRAGVGPPFIDDLLEKGLAPAPEQRFVDAAAFAAAIDNALRLVENPERPSAPQRAFRAMRQRKLATALFVAGAAVAVTLTSSALRNHGAPVVSLQSAAAGDRLTSFERGQAAMRGWNLAAAVTAFDAAVAADTSSVPARFWLAESQALIGRLDRDAFRIVALKLRETRPKLGGRDSLLAEALIAFATGVPARACDEYRKVLELDEQDPLAWFGMGDCQRLDSAVVRDARSPSGWSFSSSYHGAASAYMKVVSLDPNAHAGVPFSNLAKVLPSSASSVRMGRSPESGARFAAYPALIGDTLAFIPYPLGVFTSVARTTISPTQPEALEHDRDMLLDFARQWTVVLPGSADAWEALSLVWENRGELSDDDAGAAGTIRRARALSRSPGQRAQLGAAHARIALKRGEFALARSIADSLLEQWRDTAPPTEIAGALAGVAAFSGRLSLVSTFTLQASAVESASDGIAPPLAAAAARFNARAAPGICDDSLRALRRDFERVLDSYATPSRKDQLRTAAIWQGAALAFPCMRGDALLGVASSGPLDRAQRTFAAGNSAKTRALLDSLVTVRAGYRPGDIALDHTVQEAWLRASVGDTTAAERQLDLVLEALPTLGVKSVLESTQAAAIGRAMVLRADLAAARHNAVMARRWAGAVLDLWAGSDPALQPTLDRMHGMAGR